MASFARIFLVGLVAAVGAGTAAAQQSSQPDPRIAIAAKIPGTRADDLRASPIAGIWELTRGSDIAYVSADGKYAIAGDLYDLAANDNLTEARRRDARIKLLADVPESEMIVFGPKDAKYTVTVFTDVDCAYCRKLHSQIAEYNRLGIRVRYMSYPRSGPGTESWTKAEQVWCSSDRGAALTRAKRGEDLKTSASCPSPVAREYALGQKFDIRGTPAIVMSDGEMLGGYLPPAQLMQRLKGG